MGRNLLGIVKWFDKKKGYGFITGDEGKEYFFHYTGLTKQGYKTIGAGTPVIFDLQDVPRGVQAVNIIDVSA